jgi:hypothetical protein
MEEPEPKPVAAGVRRSWLALGALAVLLSRLAFIPETLEDLDSTNFARALLDYDPARHQPHPPGYPIYVALAKGVHAFVVEPVRALAVLSALAQAGLLLALLALFRALSPASALAATLLTIANPTLWFNGARPMSDSVGLLFIVTTQALLLRELRQPRRLTLASLLVGLTPGVRVQSLALTVPLWLFVLTRSQGRRWIAVAAALFGVLAWAVPLFALSGGFERYLAAFGDTLGQAIAFEPLLSGFTLNRAAHALRLVLVAPWAQPALGMVLLALAAAGLLVAAARRPAALGLALLAFGPYLVTHLLMQHVETTRYCLPYLPLFGFLAAEALDAAGRRLRGSATPATAAALGLAAWSAALTLPALRAFAGSPSPPYLAVRELVRVAQPPERFAVAAHTIYRPYLDSAEPGIERLFGGRPGETVPRLVQYWLEGGTKQVLFLAEPRRTDLESLDPRARRLLGRWSWSFDAERFLPGARPKDAELVQIAPPGFFAGDGYLLSLEAGKVSELPRFIERRAWLRASDEPAFLIVAGEPTGPAAQHVLELGLPGELLLEHGCGEPLLRGLLLPPRPDAGRYLELLARTRRGGSYEGAPFALRGLDYAPRSAAGFAHGSGWFYPETDERRRPFRWTSASARSLVHAPERGARLAIEGSAPVEYVGGGGRIALIVDGRTLAERVQNERAFRLEVELPGGGPPFREVQLQTERAFVPDRHQRNGDRRRLGLRIYAFRVTPL